MNKFENPVQFDISKEFDGVNVAYSDLIEVSQGSPEIGTIAINGNQVKSYRFGGPCICDGKYVYAPAYVKRFLGSGFKLAKINAENFEVEFLTKTKDLIFLDKVEGNRVYFFEDIDRTTYRYYDPKLGIVENRN